MAFDVYIVAFLAVRATVRFRFRVPREICIAILELDNYHGSSSNILRRDEISERTLHLLAYSALVSAQH